MNYKSLMIKNNLLVIGAGFIGKTFIKYAKPNNCIVIDKNDNQPIKMDRINKFDLYDDYARHDFFDTWNSDLQNIDAIINIADHYNFTNRPNILYNRYYEGFKQFLIDANKYIPHNIPLIHISSVSVFDTTGRINSYSPYSKSSLPYIRHKIYTDNMIGHILSKVNRPYSIIYLGGVYSDFCELYLLYQIINRINEKPFDINFTTIPLDNSFMSFVHVDEVADAINCVLDAYKSSRIQNNDKYIVSQKLISYKDLHNKISNEIHNKSINLYKVPNFVGKIGLRLQQFIKYPKCNLFFQPWMIDYSNNNYHVDTTKITGLGWKSSRNLYDDLGVIVNNLKNDYPKFIKINEDRGEGRF